MQTNRESHVDQYHTLFWKNTLTYINSYSVGLSENKAAKISWWIHHADRSQFQATSGPNFRRQIHRRDARSPGKVAAKVSAFAFFGSVVPAATWFGGRKEPGLEGNVVKNQFQNPKNLWKDAYVYKI